MILGLLISRESVVSSSPVTLYTWKTERLIVFKKCLLNGNKTDEWVRFMLNSHFERDNQDHQARGLTE